MFFTSKSPVAKDAKEHLLKTISKDFATVSREMSVFEHSEQKKQLSQGFFHGRADMQRTHSADWIQKLTRPKEQPHRAKFFEKMSKATSEIKSLVN